MFNDPIMSFLDFPPFKHMSFSPQKNMTCMSLMSDSTKIQRTSLIFLNIINLSSSPLYKASSTVACPWFHVELNMCDVWKTMKRIVDGKKMRATQRKAQGIVGCTPTNVPLGKSLYKPYMLRIYRL